MSNTGSLPRLYTLAEVEQITQVTRRTLYLWLESGYLNAVKVGGRWRVTQEEIDALISGQKGSYKRRVYKSGKPTGYTQEARDKKAQEAARKEQGKRKEPQARNPESKEVPASPEERSRELSRALKEAAKKQGVTQKDLAALTGIPLVTLHRKLNHIYPFKTWEAGVVAEALGLSLADLAASEEGK